MSDNQSDRPDDAAEGDEQSPTEEPTSHKKWFVAVAAVTALSVGLAAIGLAASSNEETAKSAAVTPAEVGAIKVEALVADNIANKVVGSIAAVGAGFAVKLGLEAGLSALGYETQEQKTTDQLKEINGRLDAVSNQLTEINSHLDVMSEQIATIDSDVQRSIYLARSYRVDDAIAQITDVYGAYQALLCAKGIAVEQQLNLDSTGSLYNKDNCSRSVADYESDFKGKFSSATNSRFKLLHEQLLSSSTSPSILTDFVRVYMGDRKYFTFKDSVAMRNFFTNISEYEALDAYLQSEYYVLAGRKGEAEGALSTWYNNNRAEQAIIPPMLPQGFVISLPNGVGPAATNPSLMFTQPMWIGTTAPSNLPNNRSSSTIQDLPIPSRTRVDFGEISDGIRWYPTIGQHNLCQYVWAGPVECQDQDGSAQSGYTPWHLSFGADQGLPMNADYVWSDIAIGDRCRRSSTGAITECKDGNRAMDATWKSWGATTGWRLPTTAELTKLASAGTASDISSGAAGVSCAADAKTRRSWSLRTLDVQGIWCDFGTKYWSGDSSALDTEAFYKTSYDRYFQCSGKWNRHEYVDLADGTKSIVGPLGNVSAAWASSPGITATGTGDELCIYGGLVPEPAYGQLPPADAKMKGQNVWPMSVRPITTAKGDDYLAQNAMSTQWPVIQPTAPSNLGTFFPDPSTALVTWQFPLTDGGAPITSYKVTASPAAGGGTAISCPIVYRQPDYPSFEARCAGLTAGTRFSFEVTATNSELLSGSAAITGPAAAPATATTVAPTTAVPAVSSTTTTAAPAASTTTAPVAATRDASKNVEAESFDGQCSGCSGVVTKASDGFTSGGYIGGIATGDWVRFEGVNTPAGADAKFAVRVASGATTTGTIELHADSPTGALLASVPVSNTGGWHTWTTLTAAKQSTLGTKPVYLVFKSGQSGDFVNVDWFKFTG